MRNTHFKYFLINKMFLSKLMYKIFCSSFDLNKAWCNSPWNVFNKVLVGVGGVLFFVPSVHFKCISSVMVNKIEEQSYQIKNIYIKIKSKWALLCFALGLEFYLIPVIAVIEIQMPATFPQPHEWNCLGVRVRRCLPLRRHASVYAWASSWCQFALPAAIWLAQSACLCTFC